MSSPGTIPQTSDEELTVRENVVLAQGEEGDMLFGRYRMLRELGRGGMGLVVLAHDTVLNVPVALKLIPELVVRDTEGIGDLKKEVLRGMELTHPNIVRVFSFEQDAKTAVIVMEHVQGETLGEKKAQRPNRCFDCDEILPWVEQLCTALDYAHREARIAHRDLKPGNLMLTSSGRLKVADFGIASSLSETMSRVSVRTDSSGTPPYMSPQQAMGERPTHLDDIYSLGATIYELLTGKPPFFRGNIIAQVMHEEPVAMAQRRSELGVNGCAPIPEAWEKTVAACLSKSPDARPQSGAAVLAMLTNLERALVVSPSVSHPDLRLDVASIPELRRIPPQPAPPQEVNPPRIIRKIEFNLQPLVGACSSVVRWTVDLVGGVLRPIFKLALVIAALWGLLFLKQQWDAAQIKRDEAAAKQAAAARLAEAAAAPAPASAASPQVIYLPPPRPNPLDRGPVPGPGGPGHRPPPARR